MNRRWLPSSGKDDKMGPQIDIVARPIDEDRRPNAAKTQRLRETRSKGETSTPRSPLWPAMAVLAVALVLVLVGPWVAV
jgi:hypothetical protein